jgi:hypothetical protein
MLNKALVMVLVLFVGGLAGCSDSPSTDGGPFPGETAAPGDMYVLSMEAKGRLKSRVIFEAKMLEDAVDGKPAAVLFLPKARILFSADQEEGIPDPDFHILEEDAIDRFLWMWDEAVGENSDPSMNAYELVQYLHHIELPLKNLIAFFEGYEACGDLTDFLDILETADTLVQYSEEGDDVQNFYVYLSKYGMPLCNFMEILGEIDLDFEDLVTDLADTGWYFTDLPNPTVLLSLNGDTDQTGTRQVGWTNAQNRPKRPAFLTEAGYESLTLSGSPTGTSTDTKSITYIIKDNLPLVIDPKKIAQALFDGDTDASHYSGSVLDQIPEIKWSMGIWLDPCLLFLPQPYATATTDLQAEYHAEYTGEDDGRKGLYILSVSVNAADCKAYRSETLNGYVTVEAINYFTDNGEINAEIIVSFTLSIAGEHLTEEKSQAYSINSRTGIAEM